MRRALRPIERFAASHHSAFSEYEMNRLDTRHGRTRDETYEEVQHRAEQAIAERDQASAERDRATEERDRLQAEYEAKLKVEAARVRTLMNELNAAVDAEKLPAEEKSVAEQLQQAVATMIDEKNSSDQVRLAPAVEPVMEL